MRVNELIRIGSQIKKHRKEKGWTQKEFSEKLGIPYSTYSNYENDNREPDLDTINRIAEALGVTPLDLIGDQLEYWNKSLDASAISDTVPVHEAFIHYIESLGFSIRPFVDQEGEHMEYTISRNGRSISFSPEELQQLQDEVKNYTEYLIQKQKG